ncbi:MAG TPA: asparagine synthase (glutamine-hydrolyzing) [Gemmataceae bacterium]|nr:asparagine synthase (glutamine-hydrolyzing) [Gemmataceae bacterium]
MCGIVGALVTEGHGFRVTEPYIRRLRDTLIHRGPDGAGIWVADDGRVGLGHRRLSILDLSDAAAQPMADSDGSIRVVFNGEIYNHADIRKELERLSDYRWRTDHSDTEVIVAAFRQWGIDCVRRFRGMFALAVWDARARELWLVRDRLGVKPLYYSLHHGRLTFASEIKALLQDPDQPRAVHEEAFFHYLSFLTSPAPQTLFDSIQKLPPGTWLRAGADGRVEQGRYWEVWDHVQPLVGVPERELAERVLDELRIAVRLHAVSDVPVGVFLSGGIDSSVNTALFSEGRTEPVQTFSIGYDADYDTCRNELHYARRMAAFVGARARERRLSANDLIDFLPRMIELQDEPIADPVCVPVYYVARLAREHGVIVCQVGEGSDELFWGYPSWKRALQLQRWDDLPVPRSLKRLGLAALRRLGKEKSVQYEWLRRGAARQPIFWGGAEAFTNAEKHRLLSPRLRERFAGRTSWEVLEPIYRRFRAGAWEPSPLHWMSYLDLNLRLPELLLMRVDKMTMGVSLEARVPFLDHKLVELVLSIPQAVKTRGGVLKYLLKRAVRGLIPDELIDRPKQGFGVPVYEWFLGRLGQTARQELDRFCRETDFLDVGEVGRLFDQGRGPQLWCLLNFALWWRRYIAGARSAELRRSA